MKKFSYKDFSDQDPNLHIIFWRTQGEEPTHTHDFIEIIYINSGRICHTINGKRFDTKKGDLLFLNYNSVHSFKPMGGIGTYYNICLYPETMEKFINPHNAFELLSLSETFSKEIAKENDEGVVSFDGAEQKKVEFILHSMLEEQEKRLPRYEDINEAYMSVLLSLIVRKISLPEETENDAWNLIANYINDNLNGNLSLESLAKKCFYNPSYFSRLFKKKFHVPLVEYITEKRIEKSIDLLVNTSQTIDEIGSNVGFSSRSAFYRAFQRITGKTPSEYRQNNDVNHPVTSD